MMKTNSDVRARARAMARTSAVTVVVLGLMLATGRIQTVRMSQDKEYELFLDSVHSGVLETVPAESTFDQEPTEAAVAFTARRSGLVLDPNARKRLGLLESEYVATGAHAMRAEEFGTILADWFLDDVLAKLSSDAIDQAIEAARGFDSADLPDSFKRGRSEVRLTIAEPEIVLSPLAARQALESLRESGDARDTFRVELRRQVTARIVERLAYLNAADSSRFRAERLSPVEVFLLAYSAISNDQLAGSDSDLKARMQALAATVEGMGSGKYPSPNGRLPFGTNGYLASSPLDVVMAHAAALFARMP